MTIFIYFLGGDIDENARDELNVDLEEDAVYVDNCFEGFFEQIPPPRQTRLLR